jgi:hypothetical protein
MDRRALHLHLPAVTISGALLALILFIHETYHFWNLQTTAQVRR